MAEFEMNGRRYRELPDGNVQDIGPAAGGGRIIPKSATTQRKEGAEASGAAADAALKGAQVPYAGPTAAADLTGTQLTNEEKRLAILEKKFGKLEPGYRWKADGTGQERIPGLAPDAQTAATNQKRANLDTLRAQISRVRELQVSAVKGGMPNWFNRFVPDFMNEELGRFDSAGAGLGEVGLAAFRTPGQGSQSDTELLKFIAANEPQSTDSDAKIEEKLRTVETRLNNTYRAMGIDPAQDARREAVATLGGVPDANGNVTPAQIDERGQVVLPDASLGRKDPGIGANGVQDAGTGGLTPVPEFRGMSEDVKSLIQQGASADEVIGYIAKRHRDANYPPPNDARKQFIRDVVSGRERRPDAPVGSLGQGWELLEMVENPDEGGSVIGGVADSGFGAGAISAANAVTAGNLGALAGDNAQGVINSSRAERPVSSFVGDVAGSGLAMAGINRLAALVPGGGALTGMGGLGADMLYGGARGYSEGDGDWRYALLGAGSAAAGNRAGAGLFGGDRISRPVEMAMDTAPGQRIAQMLGTEVPPRPTSGRRLVARNLPADADPVAAALAEGRALDIPITLADTTPQLRSLAGAATRNAGQEARDSVMTFQQGRQLGQADRALGQIEQSFGPTANPNRVAEALTQQARTNAAPLYDAAYAAPGRITPQLESILQTPAGQQALRNAQQIAANERRDPNALGFNAIDAEGNVALTQSPSMETLDLVKRGLDQVIEGRRDPVTGRLPTGDPSLSAVTGLRADLVRELDALNPDYAAARAAYAGPAQAREAMESGQGFMRLAPRDIEDQIGRMGPNQQDMYRLGARTSLADRVEQGRLTTNPYQTVFGSPTAQQRISSVFDEQGVNRFARAYQIENELARTGNEILGGSPTASRLAADQQLGGQIGEQLVNGAVDTALTGAPIRTGVSLLGKAAARTGIGRMKEDVASEIAQLLASETSPDIVAELLTELADRRGYINNLRGVGGRAGSAMLTPVAFSGTGSE